ncbi:hypothetical protein [Vallitalea okinawensis]|uniref:hypothetical protein n=1 Tax=Vallitalea okinawensis TaxID=2078660 RepID=UPI000CFC941C|nr:hypothetical protein [Vallitalea okinawensis]
MYVVRILGYLAFGLSMIFIISVLPAFFKDLIEMSIEFFLEPLRTSISKRFKEYKANKLSKETLFQECKDEFLKESA